MEFVLPKLPYSQESLAPFMSHETLDYHYGKHHQAYVDNLNRLLKDHQDLQGKSLEEVVNLSYNKEKLSGIYNNAAQHYNHILFWEGMINNSSSSVPDLVVEALNRDFGGVQQFKDQFTSLGMSVFGSGWVWLSLNADKKFVITKYSNAINPLSENYTPVLGCDVWEHSYYIDYRNQRAKYLQSFVDHLINWEYIEGKLK